MKANGKHTTTLLTEISPGPQSMHYVEVMEMPKTTSKRARATQFDKNRED